MRRRSLLAAAAVLSTLVAPGSGAGAATASGHNVVTRWNEVAISVITDDAATRTPSAAALYVAMVQGAVYNAVMAIDGSHELYRSTLTAPSDASVEAAAAVAAHDLLAAEFPSRAGILDAALADDLAAIPDGHAEDAGIDAGAAAAAEMLALRAGDGRFAAVPPPADGDAPGEWRRTAGPSAVTPWVAHVRPFLINDPSQFRPDGPNSLTSEDYAEQFDEVRRLGASVASSRTPEQTEIARFWTENTVAQLNRSLRGWSTERGLSVVDTARVLAMTAMTGADAMITCWNSKFHHLFWRPITAIRLADTDGNPDTIADPTWQPLSTTANHPEYTSGHACLTGATTLALSRFTGTDTVHLTIDSTIADTTVHHFATIEELRVEVENARIYGGDHFRLGGTDGTIAGDHVARWALRRYFGER